MREKLNTTPQNTKDQKGIVQAIIHQQTGQPRRMDKFLEKYNLPRLTQEETEILKRLITNNKIESFVKNLPTNKVQEEGIFPN